MSVYNVPIPCPCCLGKPGYLFHTELRVYTNEFCTACKGKAVLMVTRAQADRIQWAGVHRRGEFTEIEQAIMTAAPTAMQAMKDMMKAGYTDRSYWGIKNWRTRHGIRRTDRKLDNRQKDDILPEESEGT